MIQENIAHLKEKDLEITFYMDSCYFDDVGLQSVVAVQDGFRRGNRIPAISWQLSDNWHMIEPPDPVILSYCLLFP